MQQTGEVRAGHVVAGAHHLPIRVYFEDTDHSGMVYHAGYLRFMERGRSEFIRALGISQTGLAAGTHGAPLTFVVARIEIDFHRPARFDDLLTVETSLADLGGVRIVLRQEVRRGEEVLTGARVIIVLVANDGRPQRIPRDIRAELQRIRA